ncbi:MAG: type II secretion system minor pseudopilin GspH [Succinivibrionaceae bacterium]|nr:type II secretion system minor pseudopilin GspH [Succinivibrionaceae bacterium]
MRRIESGFTLIEILMVIFLMGMVTSMVSLALPPSTSLEGDPYEQAERLNYIMDEIADRASMEGRIIGLRVEENGYEFMVQSQTSTRTVSAPKTLEEEFMVTDWDRLGWVTYDREDIATKKNFSDEVFVSLEIGGMQIQTNDETMRNYDFEKEKHNAKAKIPQIYFYPTGEVTPFRLRFQIKDVDTKNNPIMIIGSEIGKFRMFDPEKDRL